MGTSRDAKISPCAQGLEESCRQGDGGITGALDEYLEVGMGVTIIAVVYGERNYGYGDLHAHDGDRPASGTPPRRPAEPILAL